MSGQNLRSIAIAFVAYNIDFEDRLPESFEALDSEYIDTKETFFMTYGDGGYWPRNLKEARIEPTPSRPVLPPQRFDGGDWAVVFSLFPTTVRQLIDIADAGESMPPQIHLVRNQVPLRPVCL
ncbi:MAG TPA: hypothetical protein PK648_14245 [Verrucomicrobiales bacterium]|jgi:hypothetical protein|nr:hypothetical protein [Verrucomicrobiales bacterium]